VLARYRGKVSKLERKNGKPCRFYMNGTCRFGDRCKYPHPTVDTKDASVEQPVGIPTINIDEFPPLPTKKQ
jgi:hypothetical protein